jgi:glycogen operon protein
MSDAIQPGTSHPLGATLRHGGVNFAVYSADSTGLEILLVDRHPDLHRFVRRLIALRLGRELAAGEHGLTLNQLLAQARLEWHGTRLNEPDWSEESRSLACTLWSMSGRSVFHLIASAYWKPLEFELPNRPADSASPWRRLIDTALDTPDDIARPDEAAPVPGDRYAVQPRSVVLLYAPA